MRVWGPMKWDCIAGFFHALRAWEQGPGGHDPRRPDLWQSISRRPRGAAHASRRRRRFLNVVALLSRQGMRGHRRAVVGAVVGVGREWQRPLACVWRSRPFAWLRLALKQQRQGVGVRQHSGRECGGSARLLRLSTRACLAAPRRKRACRCTQLLPITRVWRPCGCCSTPTLTASGQRLP